MTTHYTDLLASYISEFSLESVDNQTVLRGKVHILDTVAAIVSGLTLRPGSLALKYAKDRGGVEEATLASLGVRVPADTAAFAHGTAAHADESDDAHQRSRTHPGCAVVPAALAVAEGLERSGRDLVNAVILGYDIGCKLTEALWPPSPILRPQSQLMFGALFGATASASLLAGLSKDEVKSALSYAAQRASGITSWLRDPHHVEKAVDFGGLPSRSGVESVLLVRAGFTGVTDILDGNPGISDVFGDNGNLAKLERLLEEPHSINSASIKKYPVGFPLLPPVEALLRLLERNSVPLEAIRAVECDLPSHLAGIVDNRQMKDISLQHVLALGLVDGKVTFSNTHDLLRADDQALARLRRLIVLRADERMPATYGAHVTVTLANGRVIRESCSSVAGMADLPMTWVDVVGKARDLMDLGGHSAASPIIEAVENVDKCPTVNMLVNALSQVQGPGFGT